MKRLIILSIVGLIAVTAFCQTNAPATPPPAPEPVIPAVLSPSSNSVSQAAQDFAKGFQDLGINVSVAGLEKFLFGAFLCARFAMKYMLKDKSSKLYTVASHIALHMPTASAPPAAALPPVAAGTAAAA